MKKNRRSPVRRTMEFDMTSEEGRYAYFLAANGEKFHRVLEETAEWLRAQYKYNNKPWASDIRQHIFSIMEEHEVTLWGG